MHDIQRFGGGDGGVCAQLEREPQKQAKKLDAFDVLQRATSQRVAPTITSSDPERGTGSLHQAWGRGSGLVWGSVLAMGTGSSRGPGTSHVDVTIAGCTFCFAEPPLFYLPPPHTLLLSLSLSLSSSRSFCNAEVEVGFGVWVRDRAPARMCLVGFGNL